MRTSDRQRHKIRRERQHGESDEQYFARLSERLERETGLAVKIRVEDPAANEALRRFVVEGFTPRAAALNEPLIRVVKASLPAAAGEFERASERLRS